MNISNSYSFEYLIQLKAAFLDSVRKEILYFFKKGTLDLIRFHIILLFCYSIIQNFICGSGCASVDRALASDTIGPRFESSHWQTLNYTLNAVNCIEKTKIKKKMPGMAHLENLHYHY